MKKQYGRENPKPGEVYKDFQNNCYRIIALAEHAATGETMVVYQALYGSHQIYAEELSMFMGPIDQKEHPGVSREMRFELSGDNADLPDEQASEEEKATENSTETGIDPGVLAYLDADSSKERLEILSSMKDRLTDSMINTMAVAIDVEIKPGDITERYEELKYCLATKERFECRRLR